MNLSVWSCALRAACVYLGLILAMKIMGKRQVGELQISELVTTLLLSDIATLPLVDARIPVWRTILPLAVILGLEFLISFLMLKIPLLRRLMEGKPNILIRAGKPDWKEMRRARITLDELLSELRLQGVFEPEEVWCATLEQNGRLSVALRSRCRPMTPEDANLPEKEKGVAHTVIKEGRIDENELRLAGRDRAWLEKVLRERKKKPEDLIFFTVNDCGDLFLAEREEK